MSANPASLSLALSSSPISGCPPLPARSLAKVAQARLVSSSPGWRNEDEMIGFAAGDDAARLQNPLDLGQDRRRVGHVHQHGVAVGDVEGVVVEGKIGHVPNAEGRVGVSAGSRRGTGQVDLRGFHVDAVQLAGIHRLGQTHRNGPWPTAEVQDAHAGLEVREKMRGVGVHAATIEQLLEVVAVAHGVGGFLCCLVVHFRPLLVRRPSNIVDQVRASEPASAAGTRGNRRVGRGGAYWKRGTLTNSPRRAEA